MRYNNNYSYKITFFILPIEQKKSIDAFLAPMDQFSKHLSVGVQGDNTLRVAPCTPEA